MVFYRHQPPAFESDEWFKQWWEDDRRWDEPPTTFQAWGPDSGGGTHRVVNKQLRDKDDHKRDGVVLMAEKGVTPLDYLQAVMEGSEQPSMAQMQAATAILPYRHRKQPVAVENSGPDGKPMEFRATVRFVKPDAS